MIPTPINATFDNLQKTSKLFFKEPYEDTRKSGTFVMRGGVCWPKPMPNQSVQGFCVLLGLDIDTKKVYAFEETTFVCIDHIVGRDSRIEYEGVSRWFNMCWTKYFARTFFFNQDLHTQKRYRLQVSRSQMIEPKPMFKEIKWHDDETVEHSIYELGHNQQFFAGQGSMIHEAITTRPAQIGQKPGHVLWALMCAVAGMQRFPWRRVDVPDHYQVM